MHIHSHGQNKNERTLISKLQKVALSTNIKHGSFRVNVGLLTEIQHYFFYNNLKNTWDFILIKKIQGLESQFFYMSWHAQWEPLVVSYFLLVFRNMPNVKKKFDISMKLHNHVL